ncbi:hypothetical protein D3C85_885900 [compost metagenome]
MCGRVAADQGENLHERAAAVGIARRAECLQQLIPRIQRQQHGQRADVEDQHPVNHLVDGLGNDLAWFAGFSGGDADQLQAAEGKHDERHRHQQTAVAVGEEPAVVPQVAHRGLRAASAAEQHVAAEEDHADDGHDLDDREPEFHFTEDFDVQRVDQVDQHEEHGGADPGRHLRPPELHVLADGRQLGHAHQHIQHPVVPAGQETGKTAPVVVGKVTEGTGHRLFDNHLAELAHDQERDESGNRIAEDHRRPGGLEHAGRAQEQPRTNGATQGDQLNVSIFQPSLERPLLQDFIRHLVSF